MSSLPIANTVHTLNGDASLTGFRPPRGFARTLWTRLLDAIVALTERAERHLQRAAQAEAMDGAPGLDSQARFRSDAAGGGSRRAEVALGLRRSERPE